MKNLFWIVLGLLLSSCSIEVGKFTPERHALYDQGRPDCEKQPERCVSGYPW